MSSEPALFRAFHRRRLLVAAAKRLALLAGAVGVAASLWLLVSGAPNPSIREQAAGQVQVPGAPVNIVVETLPKPAATAAAATVQPAALPVTAEPITAEPATRESRWSIDIDTVGYQAELDACLWVRMDLGAVAPIVGAHNRCGGSVILDMAVGDTVTLRGTSLDGEYLIAEARDAWAGDNAGDATAGMTANVILQTCYWQSNGRELLLALVRTS